MAARGFRDPDRPSAFVTEISVQGDELGNVVSEVRIRIYGPIPEAIVQAARERRDLFEVQRETHSPAETDAPRLEAGDD